jgi:hypothetical protein
MMIEEFPRDDAFWLVKYIDERSGRGSATALSRFKDAEKKNPGPVRGQVVAATVGGRVKLC